MTMTMMMTLPINEGDDSMTVPMTMMMTVLINDGENDNDSADQ